MNSERITWIQRITAALLLVIATAVGVYFHFNPPAEPAAEAGADGMYILTGTGQGIDGDVVVEIETDGKTLKSVKVLSHNETEGIGTVAVEKIPGRIVDAQSLQVDAVTSCTVTTDAIKDGIRAALESGGFDPAVFEVAPQTTGTASRTDETLECDIVIVGAGGAGLTAASQAAELGAKVLVLEKMPMVGGNSLKATGGMNAADTHYLKEQAGPDNNYAHSTVEEFISDTMEGGHQLNDPELVSVMARKSADAIAWLDSIDAPLPLIAPTGGTGDSYLHEPEDGSAVGPYLVCKLQAQAEKLGVEILLETECTELIMDGETAVGVKAQSETVNYTIHAKAVILATGGFGANFDMMASYDPALANAVTTNHVGATGDGINMAVAVGADTVDMEQIQLHPTVYQETGLLVSESLRSHGAILVNSSGKRFTNDMSTRDAVSQAELKQDGSYAYIIFDQRIVDTLHSTQKYIASGLTVSSDTYAGLAGEMGLTGDAASSFEKTMETWNTSVAAGEDKEFGRDANSMKEDLSKAPFYAIKIAPGIHHTMGGLKIDTEAQVINTAGKPIPGLFAAGEVTGGVHGGNRIGGNAVCDFVVFGRIAGQSAFDYATK